MNIPEPVISSVIVGAISTLGATLGSWLVSRATLKSTQKALAGVNRQIQFQHAAKIAEFRQDRINALRESMAILQSIGVTPDLKHQQQEEFYRAGTKIELLMNRNDKRYAILQRCMYAFLYAETVEEKYSCNAPFVEVCQDVLNAEWEALRVDLAKATTTDSQ